MKNAELTVSGRLGSHVAMAERQYSTAKAKLVEELKSAARELETEAENLSNRTSLKVDENLLVNSTMWASTRLAELNKIAEKLELLKEIYVEAQYIEL